MDLGFANDTLQLEKYQQLIPLFYEHPAVKGITLWGYQQSDINLMNAQLLNGTTLRPAMVWLQQYFAGTYHEPPIVIFTSTQAHSSQIVNFDASASSAPNGSIISYSWNFGDGSSSGSGVSTSHTYSVSAFYTVILTVTDSSSVSTSTPQTITVSIPIAHCKPKFVGSTIKFQTVDEYFDFYWNQVTPEYLGTWTSTETT